MTTEETFSLQEELRTFLTGVKVAETIRPELRAAITVSTGLEDPLVSAVRAGADVVVAGSAGGGKTHLLSALGNEFVLRDLADDGGSSDQFVRLVPDATVAFDGLAQGLFSARPEGCIAQVVAINEGPLLELARLDPASPFAKAVALLHASQRGTRTTSFDSSAPVVLDVGGYDPIEAGVVGRLLALPALGQLVMDSPCSCTDASVCPRKLAWRQLDGDAVRIRVNDVLRLANVAGRRLLFRDIWDFIADIALGGSCEADPPTSPWFWRIFEGKSRLSSYLRSVADPSLVVYPKAEAHVWWGDWIADDIELLESCEIVPLVTDPPHRGDRYRWLKAQLFFVIRSQSILSIIRDQVDLEMLAPVRHRQVSDLVAVLNDYVCYSTRVPVSQRLELWFDMGVERRLDRARGQASLGRVPVADLEIARASAVANHPDPSIEISGSRVYLRHRASGASFDLSAEALSLLRSGRSFRVSDRPHTDMEWQLADFFTKIARTHKDVDLLSVLQLQFDTMSGDTRTYLVAPTARTIERADD
jgi:hypothetical protein